MNGSLRVPPSVLDAVRERWPTRWREWSNNVGGELAELCVRYRAEPREVLPARYGFVVAVAAPDARLIMKASVDPWASYQAEVADTLATLGIGPTVRENVVTDTGTWTIMEQVFPGSPLVGVQHPTIYRLAAVFRSMAGQPIPGTDLPMLTDWLRDRLIDDDLNDLAPGRQIAPPAKRRRAIAILDDLCDGPEGLCHGDTSPENVLRGHDGRLFLVDPRGVRGDVNYDAAVLALKAAPYASPMMVATQIASRAGLAADRVEAWLTVADAARV